MQKGQMRWRCVGGGGDECRKVKCARGALEVVGISAERSNVWEVCGRCAAGVWEVVGISAERSNACKVRRRCAGGWSFSHILRSYSHYKRLIVLEL